MIGKYHGEFYHVSDEIDEAQNRTIWRFGPFDGAVPRKIGDTTVYERDVPNADVSELIQFLKFLAQWQGHEVSIEDIPLQVMTLGRVPYQAENVYKAKIVSVDAVFAHQYSFEPERTDRGEAVSWFKVVDLSTCSHIRLEMMMPDDSVEAKNLTPQDVISRFGEMVLNLRNPPARIPIKVEVETALDTLEEIQHSLQQVIQRQLSIQHDLKAFGDMYTDRGRCRYDLARCYTLADQALSASTELEREISCIMHERSQLAASENKLTFI